MDNNKDLERYRKLAKILDYTSNKAGITVKQALKFADNFDEVNYEEASKTAGITVEQAKIFIEAFNDNVLDHLF